jgi:hypothetical protein
MAQAGRSDAENAKSPNWDHPKLTELRKQSFFGIEYPEK